MPFWRYNIEGVQAHKEVQPLDPIRRGAHIQAETKTAEHLNGEKHSQDGDFETAEAIAAYTQSHKKTDVRKPAVLASQIMSAPVIHVGPQTLLGEVRKMVREKRFRHVPVVSAEGHICGIISDRDLFANVESHKAGDHLTPQVVEDLMTHDVLTATPDTSIREIARVLFEERIGCMPIVDDDKQVVGVITRSDILRALIKQAPLDLWI